MASFKYSGISVSGEKINGVIEATDRFDAVAKIKETCSIVEDIQEVRGKGFAAGTKNKKLDAKTLSLLCSRFAIILGVGLPIVQAVDMLAGQMKEKSLKNMLSEVSADVAMGRNLSASFAARGDSFPVTFVETVRSGEESGDLIKAFQRLSTYYEKASKTKQKLTGALIYPVFVIVVAIVVIGIIMAFAVPSFTKAFESLNIELPWVTRFVIGLSNFITGYGIWVVLIVAAVLLAGKLYARTEKGAEIFSAAAISLPLAGNIIQLSAASQFAHTMSMMISAGMPILKCIDAAGKGIGNYVMRRDIISSAAGVEGGQSLGSCLRRSQYLPPLLVEMTVMGEATGTLETTLSAVGEFYDNEVEVATARVLTMLEPAIICVLAGFVVLILFSVYLPMFSLYGSM